MNVWMPISNAPVKAGERPAGPMIVGVDADGRVAKTQFVRHPVKGDAWIMQDENGERFAWEPVAWVPEYLAVPPLPWGARIAHIEYDVDWLPKPNRVDLILSDEEAPEDLTRTAFLIPYTADRAVVLAHHVDRGIEIAGGHIEPRETMLYAAVRELREETGIDDVDRVEPLGYLRMICEGERPAGDYAYPFPLSYQQIYTGRVVALGEFAPTEECHAPVVTADLDDPRITRATVRVYGEAARRIALQSL